MALRAAAAAAACVALAVVGCGGKAAPGSEPTAQRFHGTSAPSGTAAADFALRDQNGRLVRLSAQRGRLVLVAFLYTSCPDICPLIAQRLDAAVRSLGQDASSVRILAVSVDPVGDTPLAARRYVRTHRLSPEFHWLLGDRRQLAAVWQSYNILVEQRSPETIAHAAPVFLLDRSGRPRVFYDSAVRSRAVAQDLRLLLRS